MSGLNQWLEIWLLRLLALQFAGLIFTVLWQVLARNVLQMAALWTLDVAQLLFAWGIFPGAAVALRWDTHFHLELFSGDWRRVGASLKFIGDLGALAVALVMTIAGWQFAQRGWNREVLTLGISEFWYFLSIPLAGALMLCFLVEILPRDLGRLRESFSR